MDFSKVVFLVVFMFLLLINDSSQFLVANCVWDDALSSAPLGDLRGFVLSDADACALFCSKTGGVVVTSSSDTQSAISNPNSANAALCDRCCKSSQPPSKPGELLVSILHTFIKAFGPSKSPQPQTGPPAAGAGGTAAPPAGKPAPGQPPVPGPRPPAGELTTKRVEHDDEPLFDTGGAGMDVNFSDDVARAAVAHHDFDNHYFEPEPSTAEPRRNRAYPKARIFEVAGRDDRPAFSDGFDHATDRGPGWPHPGSNFPVKSGSIR